MKRKKEEPRFSWIDGTSASEKSDNLALDLRRNTRILYSKFIKNKYTFFPASDSSSTRWSKKMNVNIVLKSEK